MPTIEQLEKLLKVDPDDPFVHYGLGQERAKLGQHDDAVGSFDRTLALDPNYCYAYYFKAISLGELGRKHEALGVLKEGITRAQEVSDAKALSELRTLLATIE